MNLTHRRLSLLLLNMIALIWLINWSTSKATIDENKKQSVNFYGKLITRQSKTAIAIDNISVDGKYRQIAMLEKPSLVKSDMQKSNTNHQTNQEMALAADPTEGLAITKIDLNEVSEISVPQPIITW